MKVRTPSRYEPPPFLAGRLRHSIDVAIEVALMELLTLFVERVALGRWGRDTLLPRLVQRMAPRLSLLEQGFDANFYLHQFEDEAQRGRVSRAPLLHYALLGWRTRRAPAPAFDPAFYRRSYLGRPRGMDPLLHHLERESRSQSPRNEVEARADRVPWREGAETVLVFHHARGGGSSHFLDLYEREIEGGGRNVLRVRTVLKGPTLAVIGERTFDLASDLGAMAKFARQRNVTRLLVNHIVDRPQEAMRWVRDLGERLGVPYDVVLHDYFMLCPRIDLVTGQGVCCDVAPTETCEQCVTQYGAEAREVDPRTWRRDHLDFLTKAERIVAPSDDLAMRMRRFLPKEIEVWEPESESGHPPERTPRISPGEPLRIVALGAVNVSKGVRVLQALAAASERSGAPLRISVLGPTSEPMPTSVQVTGAYSPPELDRLLTESATHVVFLPAIWPESWSFVLTAALARGLPVVAFDTGAPAARLRRLGRGDLLPLALSRDPAALLASLLKIRERWVVR